MTTHKQGRMRQAEVENRAFDNLLRDAMGLTIAADGVEQVSARACQQSRVARSVWPAAAAGMYLLPFFLWGDIVRDPRFVTKTMHAFLDYPGGDQPAGGALFVRAGQFPSGGAVAGGGHRRGVFVLTILTDHKLGVF